MPEQESIDISHKNAEMNLGNAWNSSHADYCVEADPYICTIFAIVECFTDICVLSDSQHDQHSANKCL